MTTYISFQKKVFALCAMLTLLFSACDDDGDTMPNEQELITTVRLTFSNATESLIFKAEDADGPGGNPIVVDDILLATNTNYDLSVEFLDAQDPDNVADITEEVKEEDLEHLVCYTAEGVPAPQNFDLDSNGHPLGLTATYSTANAATGSLKVSLKHLPDKDAPTPCNTGETDVEVTFNVVIK